MLATMIKERQNNRLRTILGAQAVFGNGLLSVECQVRDISDVGAKLTSDRPMDIPDEFQLEVPRKHLSHKAVVRWREGNALGVEFKDETKAPMSADDMAARIAQLEAENGLLRRRIAEMAIRLDSYGDSERSPL